MVPILEIIIGFVSGVLIMIAYDLLWPKVRRLIGFLADKLWPPIKDVPIKEGDVVILRKEYDGHPATTVGCIVHEYPNSTAVEVELFRDGKTLEVITVQKNDLAFLPYYNKIKGSWSTIKEIMSGLKSGKVTAAQIRDSIEDLQIRVTLNKLCLVYLERAKESA
jgi:hypothetical protein